MTVRELIIRLQQLENTHGECRVMHSSCDSSGWGISMEVTDATTHTTLSRNDVVWLESEEI